MQTGEVIQLGRHRLLCGDAFNPEHVDVLMQGEKPDMLYCDPPYGIGTETKRESAMGRKARSGLFRPSLVNGSVGRKNFAAVIGDEKPFDLDHFICQWKDAEQFWWGADYYSTEATQRGSWIVWDKRTTPSMEKVFGSHFEMCWSKTKHRREIVHILWCGLYGQNGIDQHRRHPTQKPVKLAEWFISRYSKPDALVLDLFGGAGGTLLACERLNRTCYMSEISPDYCDVIIQRYEQMTQQPKLLEVS